jgi:hypothetical protein
MGPSSLRAGIALALRCDRIASVWRAIRFALLCFLQEMPLVFYSVTTLLFLEMPEKYKVLGLAKKPKAVPRYTTSHLERTEDCRRMYSTYPNHTQCDFPSNFDELPVFCISRPKI